MKLSKWKVTALSIGAGALVFATISPAFGGPSLSDLVKQEVSKQLNAQVSAKKKKRGPPGPQGPQGLQGLQGTPGTPGSSNVTVQRTQLDVGANSNDSDWADCPPGQRATGGGVGRDGGGSFVNGDKLIDSMPTIGHTFTPAAGSVATSWFGGIANNGGSAFTAHLYVLCVPNP